MTTLIILNDETHDIIKIVKSVKDSRLLVQRITETVQNAVKEQNRAFLSALLGTLGRSLLGDLLIGVEISGARKGKGVLRAGYGNNDSKMDF